MYILQIAAVGLVTVAQELASLAPTIVFTCMIARPSFILGPTIRWVLLAIYFYASQSWVPNLSTLEERAREQVARLLSFLNHPMDNATRSRKADGTRMHMCLIALLCDPPLL
jgi:hypothetical protein